MAEAEKKAEAPKAAPKGKDGKKGSIVGSLIIASIVMTIISFGFITVGMGYVAAVLVIGMMPGLAAQMVDRRPGKYASKTVMAFNIAGMLPHLAAMLYSSNPNSVAQNLFDDPMTWLWIYMFASFGWLVIHLLPQISFLMFSIKAEYKMKKIRSFQELLVREWGEEITR